MLARGNLKVKTGYLTAILLLLISYFLIFYTLQKLLEQTKWVEHTDLVINHLESLSSYTNEAESAARGFMLLNDNDHLTNFYESTKRIDALLKDIDSITSDNRIQQKNSDTLKSMIQEKLGAIYRGILLYKQGGNTITDEMKSKGEVGKKLMVNIRGMIDQMEIQERRVLEERKEKLRGVSVSIRIVTFTSLIIAIILSTYSFITYKRESAAKS